MGSAGREMGPPVERQTVFGKIDPVAILDWVGSSEGEVGESAAGCVPGVRLGEDPVNGP